MLVGHQVRLFSAFENSGDSSINHDYAVWIRGFRVPECPSSIGIFQPLWQKPQDPDIATAVDWLFVEERMEGGKWKHYYGFVGRHIVAKVPAEEIELVNPIRPAATTRP
jgi:hypothetical protein